jgi:hypothetical protein
MADCLSALARVLRTQGVDLLPVDAIPKQLRVAWMVWCRRMLLRAIDIYRESPALSGVKDSHNGWIRIWGAGQAGASFLSRPLHFLRMIVTSRPIGQSARTRDF